MLQQIFHKTKNKVNLFLAKKKRLQLIKSDISNKYGLNITKFKPLTNGFVHLSYKCVTDNNKAFVLRVLRDDDANANTIQLEGNLLDRLNKDPYVHNRIVTMVSDKNGQKCGQINQYLYCLFNYINHDKIVRMDDNHIQAITFLVRRIHDTGVHFYQYYEERELLDAQQINNNLFECYSKKIISQDEFNIMKNIVVAYNTTIEKYPTKTILHCDVHRGNLLLNKDNNQMLLLDFDDFCVGPAILDLAIMMQMFCLEKNVFDIKMAKKILKAYYEVSSIPINYPVNDLITFMLFNLVCACEYYLQVSDGAYRSNEFNIAYQRISEVQSCAEIIIKELEVIN